MIEFTILVVLLILLLRSFGRSGTDHLLSKRNLTLLMVVGWFAGVLAHALPITGVGPGIGLNTLLVGVCGLVAGRLLHRIGQAWALSKKGWQEEDPDDPPRMVHPLILLGMFLSGVPMIFALLAARHETLEVESTPRDAETGIIRGAEERTLTAADPDAEALLLVHGFLSSPTDFGKLPERLHEAGYTVRVPLLPGHGRTPAELAEVTPEQYIEAVRTEWDALRAAHGKTSLIGFSFGGALSLLVSQDAPPRRLVLANPYGGHAATPSWSPIDTDALTRGIAPFTSRIMRPDGFTHVNRREGLEGHVIYRTVPVPAALELQEIGKMLRKQEPARAVRCPTLVLSSSTDGVVPVADVLEVHEVLDAATGGKAKLVRYELSDHLLFLDNDREEATAEILRFLAEPD